MVEIAEPAVMRSASVKQAVGKRPQAGAVLSDAPGFAPERFAARFFSSRRRAYRSMMMFVIIALAGLLQLPPSRSLYCANAGAEMTSNNKIGHQPLKRIFFLLIMPISISVFFVVALMKADRFNSLKGLLLEGQ